MPVYQRYWTVIFSLFFCNVFGLGIRVVVALCNEFESLPFSSIFWNSLRRIDISSSLYVWQNSPGKPSSPGFLFAASFFKLQIQFHF